jgi:hypothetical protein
MRRAAASFILKTDQPGRLLAVFLFAPMLVYKAHVYKDTFLWAFAWALFLWDMWWLLFAAPRVLQKTL